MILAHTGRSLKNGTKEVMVLLCPALIRPHLRRWARPTLNFRKTVTNQSLQGLVEKGKGTVRGPRNQNI